jgi:hypothetical protein
VSKTRPVAPATQNGVVTARSGHGYTKNNHVWCHGPSMTPPVRYTCRVAVSVSRTRLVAPAAQSAVVTAKSGHGYKKNSLPCDIPAGWPLPCPRRDSWHQQHKALWRQQDRAMDTRKNGQKRPKTAIFERFSRPKDDASCPIYSSQPATPGSNGGGRCIPDILFPHPNHPRSN